MCAEGVQHTVDGAQGTPSTLRAGTPWHRIPMHRAANAGKSYHRGNNLRGFLGRAKIRRGNSWYHSLEIKGKWGIRSLVVVSSFSLDGY